MPFQSKRISLSALGIDVVPGMESGNHLRIGFDPRMGFPPCGFLLYRRAHETGPTTELDFGRLFSESISAPFRHGYLQDGVAVFHPKAPPPQHVEPGLVFTNQIVGISFRSSPFMPDSDPKVCEVRLTVSWDEGVVTVQGFDDRYDQDGFRKILVAHQESTDVSQESFELRADLISLVEIQAPEGARLNSFEYTVISEGGWEQLSLPAEAPWGTSEVMPLLLPVPEFVTETSSGYSTCPALEFPRSTTEIYKELAESRLRTGFVARTGSDDVHGEYDDVDQFLKVYLGPGGERLEELIESLRALQAVPPPEQLGLKISNPGDSDEEITTFAPLPMILSGAVEYAFARLIGLAAIDKSSDGSSLDYMVEAQWTTEVSHYWITHDVFPGRDELLADPMEPQVDTVLDLTRPGNLKTNVQLNWQAPSGVERVDRAKQYAGYHVFRSGERLTQSIDELSEIITPDLVLLGEVQGNAPTPPPSAEAGSYLDRNTFLGNLEYGLQAQDLFGRRSEITWAGIQISPTVINPPPVSDLFAFYLDTADPSQQLDAQAVKILAATGQSSFTGTALLISFRYPKASIDEVSNNVESFIVAYQHGRPNQLLGTLSTPVIVGPLPAQATAQVSADVDLTTVTPVPVGINGFGGQRSRGTLESRGEFFKIESATRLGTNLVRLRVRARRDYLPQVGEASLTFGGGTAVIGPHPLYVFTTGLNAWTGFDLRHPRGTNSQGYLRLSGSNNSVLTPLPAGITAGQLVVSRTVEPPGNLGEGEAALPRDWVYRLVVKDIQLPLPAGLSEYPGAVTVGVVSGQNRASALPPPAYVVRRAYGAPPPLTELATSEFLTATRPDFEGRIGVPLSWPKIAGVTHFNVYRVEVPKLLDSRGASLQLAQNLLENETNRAQVRLLGGQLASVSAFTLITPVPIAPETDPDAPTRHRWTDRVTAPREQSYVYRVQPLSTAGNEAPWPPDSASNNENRNRCILVLQKNRDALLPPAIYELEPLDRSIGVVVRNPLSPTVNGLRIYKTDQSSKVSDVRSMMLIHGTIPFTHARIQLLPAANGTPARVKFVDEKVQVGTQYFYRVIFVDEFGNFSQASEPMAATPRSFAPPEPPTLSATRTAPDTVNLAWQADHNEGQVKPQRKRSGQGQWLDLTPDFLAPTGSFVDDDAVGITAHRLLLRDAKGRVVFSDMVITEA